jgi:hypothetical protein
MTKREKLELEIMAIRLWFQTFGLPNMSSDADRVYMSSKLNKLLNEQSKTK